jgi:hypothetical protein
MRYLKSFIYGIVLVLIIVVLFLKEKERKNTLRSAARGNPNVNQDSLNEIIKQDSINSIWDDDD